MNPRPRHDMRIHAAVADRRGTGHLVACTDRWGHRFVPSVFRANYEVCERCRYGLEVCGLAAYLERSQ